MKVLRKLCRKLDLYKIHSHRSNGSRDDVSGRCKNDIILSIHKLKRCGGSRLVFKRACQRPKGVCDG